MDSEPAKTALPSCLCRVVYLIDYAKGRFLHEARSRLSAEEYQGILKWAREIREPLAFEPATESEFIVRLLRKYREQLLLSEV